MLGTNIVDGLGTGRRALVDDQNGLVVSVLPCPPKVRQQNKVFRQYFTADGTASGSNDMGIDGSGGTRFWVPADDENDRYITRVDFMVGYGTAAGVWEWADANAALSNGHRFYYERDTEEIDIHEAIKCNSDLMRICVDILPTSWEVRNLGAANDYGYLCAMDTIQLLPPYGIKLDAGSNQRLVIQLRDNLTGHTDTFNAVAYGFERFE